MPLIYRYIVVCALGEFVVYAKNLREARERFVRFSPHVTNVTVHLDVDSSPAP